jgi:DHA2 family multidrug resistance protein
VVAPVLGPALGGWITDNYSWRWIFLINIPVGIIAFMAVTALVRDPPATREQKSTKGPFDFIGLGLIILGLGTFQIMLDRGEDADWFTSPFIGLLAVFAVIGIGGAVVWLLRAKHPIVNLRVLADRNFAVGCILIFAMAIVLYSSSVLLPQLSELQFGYTATLAGEFLVPGALALIVLIIVVGRIMPRVQTRFIIMFGYAFLGVAFLYSASLTPDLDFWSLVKMRVFQTAGLGFLFVPISSVTYLTLPRNLNGDAAALFTMFRNIAGSIGISLSTALLTTRSQVRMAYLGEHQTATSQPYLDTVAAITRTIEATGVPHAAAQQSAIGHLYQQLIGQSQLLAYTDVFVVCAILAFCVAPLALLFPAVKAGGGGGAAH